MRLLRHDIITAPGPSRSGRRRRIPETPRRRAPSKWCRSSVPCGGRLPMIHPFSLFSDALQIGKTGLEVLADHAVHVEKHVDDFRKVGRVALHLPRDVSAIPPGLKRELDDVVGLEWLDEIQFDADLGRRRSIRDLHASLADVLVAFPRV